MDLGLADRRFLVGGASRGLGAAVRVPWSPRAPGWPAYPGTPSNRVAPRPPASSRSRPTCRSATAPPWRSGRRSSALGGLDGLVVNSGGPPGGTFETVDEAAWERAIAGTLHSTLRLIRESLPHLRAGRDPSIVIVLSSSVREPIPALITSNVLRPGLAGLIKSLVTEIAPIRINGVAPGRFDTDRVRSLDDARAAAAGVTVDVVQAQMRDRIPLGRYGDPDELGRVVAFLLSPAASYLDGVILPVDGGMIRSLP